MARADTLDLGAWFILRMSSAATLSVCEGLKRAGFDVWTPVERKIGRMPRTRTAFDKQRPLMPSYVFANVQDIDALAELAVIPNRECPRFTLFRHNNGIPLIADEELEALRAEESRMQRIFDRQKVKGRKGPSFEKGASVKAQSGGFEGLSGIVEGTQGQYTLVTYAGFGKPIKIASLLLLPDEVTNRQSQDTAAQEAA